jgi:hypothetical protein
LEELAQPVEELDEDGLFVDKPSGSEEPHDVREVFPCALELAM